MGSFLWTEIIKKNNLTYLNNLYHNDIKLLKKYKPEMITLRDMAMPFVKKYTNPNYVSWIVDKQVSVNKKKNIKSILLVGGGTGIINDKVKIVINQLIKDENLIIYTSPNIYKKYKNHDNLISFGFSDKEFLNIDLIIGRPGIGTITDSIKYKIPIFTIGEDNNYEIQHNISKILKLNIGLDLSNRLLDCLNLIEHILKNNKYSVFQKSLSKIKTEGLSETKNFILNKVYE